MAENELEVLREQLRQTQQRLDHVVSMLHLGEWQYNLSTQTLWLSEDCKALLGYDEGDFPETPQQLLHPDDQAYVLAGYRAYLAQPDTPFMLEYRARHRDGGYRWVLDHTILTTNSSGDQMLLGEIQNITGRVAARERYNTIIRSSLDAFWRLDRGGNFLEVNDKACDLLGYSREELLVMLRLQDIEYEVSDADTLLRFQHLVEQGADRYEARYLRKDNAVIDVEISVRFHAEGEGEFYVFARDVGEDRLLRRELLASEQRFRRALEEAPYPVMIRANSGRILMMNRKWREITGYTRQDILTVDDWFERAYPGQDTREVVLNLNQRITHGENVSQENLMVRCKDGSQRSWSFKAISLYDIYNDRKLIVTMAVDMTDILSMQREIESSETHYRSLLGTLAAGVVVHGPDGRILLSNTAAREMLGMVPSDILGTAADDPVWHFLREDGSIMPVEEYPVNRVLTTRQPIVNYLVGVKRSDLERPLWALVNGRPEFDSSGDIRQVVVTFVDISRRVEAQQALNKLTEELRRSNTDLEQFAYIASHDLQEPLRMVTSYLQFIETRYMDKLDDEGREFIGFAVDGARRMQMLIRDLLTYSRVGVPNESLEPVSVQAALDWVLNEMSGTIEERGAHIRMSGEMPRVSVDENQLVQVFQNLLGNALKFSKDDPVVEIAVQRDGDMWQFSVRDNGIGIPEKYQQKIFVIFRRLHSREEYPGTGIGLAVCKRIVEGYGGRIWLESAADEGATFYFTLPVMKET